MARTSPHLSPLETDRAPSAIRRPVVRLDRAIEVVERNALWVLAALMVLDAVLLLYMGRDLTFFYDDWDFVTHDFGGGIHSLLAAHVGNLVFFPVAIYKVLFHLVGIHHYVVYRLVVIVLHLLSAALVFILASRRIARLPALLATSLILFLGAAWEDLLWAFQTTYMLSVAGALAAWVLLERRDRWGDIGAMLCLIVAVGSSSLGIPVILGVAVELAWQRDWRRGWVVVVPAVLYGLWYLRYGENQITTNELINAPGFAADLAAAAFGGLIGRGLEWGRPIALLATILLLIRLARPRPISARLAGLLATGLWLWIAIAVTRSTISPPESSHYIYLGAVVIVLVGVELLRDVWISPRVTVIATVLVAFFAVTGLTVLHAGASTLRPISKTVTAELGALELAAAYAPPGYQPEPLHAPQIKAGPYLHTVRAMHSTPADTPTAILESEPPARAAADGVLLALYGPTPKPLRTTPPSRLAPAPAVVALAGAAQSQRGACVHLTPVGGSTATTVLTLPHGGVLLRNEGGAPASLALRRFGETFDPISGVSPHSAVALPLPSDAAQVPWQLQASSSSPISVCGVQA